MSGGTSFFLMCAILLSLGPPTDGSTLPKYDQAPAPVVASDSSEPAPLTPEKARRMYKSGTKLLIAGPILLVVGIAGLSVAIQAAAEKPEFGSDYFDQQRRASLREGLGLSIGGPLTSAGVALTVVGGVLRSQARSTLRPKVAVVPTWFVGGGGIAVGGRF
jgi:hypothetical protein